MRVRNPLQGWHPSFFAGRLTPLSRSSLADVLKKTGSFYYHCDWHAKGEIFKPVPEQVSFQIPLRALTIGQLTLDKEL